MKINIQKNPNWFFIKTKDYTNFYWDWFKTNVQKKSDTEMKPFIFTTDGIDIKKIIEDIWILYANRF